MDNYNYKANIKVITTPSGDKVITMNSQIYVALLNNLYDARYHHEEHNRQPLADDIIKMWKALNDKWED